MYDNLKIIFYPDPRLKKASTPVDVFDADLKALTDRMFELMRQARGVGLAAPQVGINKRLFVMNPTGKPEDDRVVINPILTEAEGEATAEEGCLSLPDIHVDVDRFETLKLTAQDVTGKKYEDMETGFIARIWQHETDHLNGVLLIDRMGFVQRAANRRKLKALEEQFVPLKKK